MTKPLPVAMTSSQHVYEVRPREDHRGVNLVSDALPFGRLWYGEPNAIRNAIGYVKFRSRSHDAVIRVYDDAGNVIEMYEHALGELIVFGISGETKAATLLSVTANCKLLLFGDPAVLLVAAEYLRSRFAQFKLPMGRRLCKLPNFR